MGGAEANIRRPEHKGPLLPARECVTITYCKCINCRDVDFLTTYSYVHFLQDDLIVCKIGFYILYTYQLLETYTEHNYRDSGMSRCPCF